MGVQCVFRLLPFSHLLDHFKVVKINSCMHEVFEKLQIFLYCTLNYFTLKKITDFTTLHQDTG